MTKITTFIPMASGEQRQFKNKDKNYLYVMVVIALMLIFIIVWVTLITLHLGKILFKFCIYNVSLDIITRAIAASKL